MPSSSNKKSSRKAKILPQFSIYSGNKPLLDLLEIQRKSFFDLLERGIIHELYKTDIFRETTKNSGFTQELELAFNPETYKLVSPNCTPKQAILKGKTYACKLYVQATLTIRSSPRESAGETDTNKTPKSVILQEYGIHEYGDSRFPFVCKATERGASQYAKQNKSINHVNKRIDYPLKAQVSKFVGERSWGSKGKLSLSLPLMFPERSLNPRDGLQATFVNSDSSFVNIKNSLLECSQESLAISQGQNRNSQLSTLIIDVTKQQQNRPDFLGQTRNLPPLLSCFANIGGRSHICKYNSLSENFFSQENKIHILNLNMSVDVNFVKSAIFLATHTISLGFPKSKRSHNLSSSLQNIPQESLGLKQQRRAHINLEKIDALLINLKQPVSFLSFINKRKSASSINYSNDLKGLNFFKKVSIDYSPLSLILKNSNRIKGYNSTLKGGLPKLLVTPYSPFIASQCFASTGGKSNVNFSIPFRNSNSHIESSLHHFKTFHESKTESKIIRSTATFLGTPINVKEKNQEQKTTIFFISNTPLLSLCNVKKLDSIKLEKIQKAIFVSKYSNEEIPKNITSSTFMVDDVYVKNGVSFYIDRVTSTFTTKKKVGKSDKNWISKDHTESVLQRSTRRTNLSPFWDETVDTSNYWRSPWNEVIQLKENLSCFLTSSIPPVRAKLRDWGELRKQGGYALNKEAEETQQMENHGSVKIFRPWIFLGELPLMTKRGHFILNGSPRVIVNQIARCPGIYFQEKRRGVGFEQEVRVSADLIPQRGPWLRIQSDWEGRFWARLKREGRVKYATLYEAFQEFEKEYSAPLVSLVTNSSSSFPKSEIFAFHERKAKEDRQKKALVRLFKNSTRYSLGKQGRSRISQRVHSQKVVSQPFSSQKLKKAGVAKASELHNFWASLFYKNVAFSTTTDPTNPVTLQSSYPYYSIRMWQLLSPKGIKPLLFKNMVFDIKNMAFANTNSQIWSSPVFTNMVTPTKTPRGPYSSIPQLLYLKHREQKPYSSIQRFAPNTSTGDPISPLDLSELYTKPLSNCEALTGDKELTTDNFVDHVENVLMAADINAVHTYLEHLLEGQGFTDDIDHLKNRLVRTSGKLLQQQLELGLNRLNEVITPLLGNLIQGQLFSSLSSPENTPVIVKAPLSTSNGKSVTSFGDPVTHTSLMSDEVSTNMVVTEVDNLPTPSSPLFTNMASEAHIREYNASFPKGDQRFAPNGKHTMQLNTAQETLTHKKKGLIGKYPSQEMEDSKVTGSILKRGGRGCFARNGGMEVGERENPNLKKKRLVSLPSTNSTKVLLTNLTNMASDSFARNTSRVVTNMAPKVQWGSFSSLENETPFRWLRTSKPVNNAFREFFGSNPLSQYMDQTNPLAEITHKRRLSSMGPGGIKRETAGMEVRGIHPTHYGRVCPIETPEGKNAGLVNSPTVYGRIGNNGFMETPLYQVLESQVQMERWTFFSAQQEEDEESSLATGDTGLTRFNLLSGSPYFKSITQYQGKEANSPIPVQTANNPLAHFQQVERNRVGYKALSPVQTISIATALIPFLEHDDANRALMGSNMQRQAIPLLSPERPIVGTGFEPMVTAESGQAVQAIKIGCVSHVSANKITLQSIDSILPSGEVFEIKNAASTNMNDLVTSTSNGFKSKISRTTFFLTPSSLNNHILYFKYHHIRKLHSGDSISNIYRKFFHTMERYNSVWWNRSTFRRGLNSSLQSWLRTGHNLERNNKSKIFSHAVFNFFPTLSVIPPLLSPQFPLLPSIYECGPQSPPETIFVNNTSLFNIQGEYKQVQRTCFANKESHILDSKYLEIEDFSKYKEESIIHRILNISNKIPYETATKLHLCSTQNSFILKKVEQPLQIYQRSNQETCVSQRPLVQEGDWVQKGDFLADCSASHSGDLALGKNVTVAYMPWEGYNFEDAIVISDRLVANDIYTSIHIERYEIKVSKNSQGKERITNQIPSLPSRRLKHLDNSGIARVSSWVQPGDILVGKVVELKRPLSPYERLAWELASRLSPTSPEREKWLSKVWLEDMSLRLPPGVCGRVINFQIISTEWLEKEQLAHPLEVHVYLAVKRKIQVGDKLAGRHGNKGIVSIVLPRQDMPYLADGTSVDMVLNPLGVPSRMNLGQIFECLLGLAGSQLGCNFKVTPFDEIAGGEASRSLVFLKLYQCRLMYKQQWLFTPTFPGKNKLFDGRTGEPFENWVTVGQAYMLKLIHMVDHKIHARSTGPYSLFTRQPVRGRSRRGGQRLGEMEVWAVEGFGAAYTLQEFLTIKSDDLKARAALQRSFYKQNDVTLGKVHISPGNPEAFKVLVSELQALCLHIQM